ncbi:Asx homology domain-containing protein [Echria macrotheca]|uniref:Asx homology domain-containing protein n=1 Tax=Echria macrotheca TaxID=438768 RepID=A0AAJ0BMM3_9PEZI|nr:Asx homology domain-containing protein [Echria macrotheca]
MSQSSGISRLSSPPDSLFRPSSEEEPDADDDRIPAPRSSRKTQNQNQTKRPILEQLIEMEEHAAAVEAAAVAETASPQQDQQPPSTVPTKRKASDQGRKNNSASSKAPRRSVSSSSKKKPASSTKPKPKPRKSKIPSVAFALTDPKSPLAKADIRAILMHPLSWSSLTPPEQHEILTLFPDPQKNILPADPTTSTPSTPRPNLTSLSNDDNYRNDCARYAENLSLGRHDPEWLRQAWVAHERHRAGDFDEYLEKDFESTWGETYPVEHRALVESSRTSTTAPLPPRISDLENLTLVSSKSTASPPASASAGGGAAAAADGEEEEEVGMPSPVVVDE